MTTTITPHERLLELRLYIDRLDQVYFNEANQAVPDHEYDSYKAELRELCPTDERLTRVGCPVPRDSMRTKFKHPHLVGSITNSKDFDAAGSYVDGFKKWAAGLPANATFVVTPKVDGFSLVAYYEGGKLIRAVTRGDSDTGIGEDVTANAVCFKGLPTQLTTPMTWAVRGEAVLLNEDWAKADPDKSTNTRNLAAGIARRSDGVGAEHLTFIAFDAVPGAHMALFRKHNFNDVLDQIQANGINTVPFAVADNTDAVLAYHTKIGALRANLPFGIDGVVVRVAQMGMAEDLGVSGGCPKCMVAVKYPAEEATTTITDVIWTVGHTGKLNPVAVLRPVDVGGVTVSTATLCNMDEINRLNVGIEDQVVVYRAGDVTPKIARVVYQPQGYEMPAGHPPVGAHWPIVAPVCCPACGGPIQNRTNTDGEKTVDLYCVNENCSAKKRGKIERWISSLDIQGLGEENIPALMSSNIQDGILRQQVPAISCIADLYNPRLTRDALASIEVNGRKLGAKRAASILDEIDKTRTLTIDQFLGSLGVEGLGKRRVELIRKAWLNANASTGYLPELLNDPHGWFTDPRFGSKLIETAAVLGIPNIAVKIQYDLNSRRAEIEELLNYITIKSEAPAAPRGTTLAGISFCLTGSMSKPRPEIEADIVAAGGEIKSVSKKLNYLVVGEGGGGKADKARELGIKIIDEAALVAIMGGVA